MCDAAELGLAKEIRRGQAFFFAGAGISVESGLPSVADIITRTGKWYLPSHWRHHESCTEVGGSCSNPNACPLNWLQKVQPEQFYGILLKISNGDLGCLGMWASLHEDSQESATTPYGPRPNVVHYIIANYSYNAGVPIFTVNFDTMFERACRELGVPYQVFGPDDAPPSSFRGEARPLPICKLHGSVQSASGVFTPGDLRTTMEGITRRGRRWIDFLRDAMRDAHIVFAGYSGRDIDYYPSMLAAATAGQAERPFWFDRFDRALGVVGRETFERAAACRAELVTGYPSDLLRDRSSPLYFRKLMEESNSLASRVISDAAEGVSASMWGDLSSAKNELLDSQMMALPRTRCPEPLVWLELLVDTGRCIEAEEYSERLLAETELAEVSPRHRILALSAAMTVARERGKFLTYRMRARTLYRVSRRGGIGEIGSLLNSRLQVTSSYQMELPGRLPFAPPWNLGDYLLLIWVLLRFHFLDPLFFLRLRLEYSSKAVEIARSSVIAEARVRRLALWISALEKLGLARCPPLIRLLERLLGRLAEEAREVGNYRTLVSVSKYQFRVTGKQEYRWQGEDVAVLIGDLSALAIFKRDAVASRVTADAHGPEFELAEAVSEAERNGNALNEVKCILALAELRWTSRSDVGSESVPLIDNTSRLLELVAMIGEESPRLRRVLAGACDHVARLEDHFRS